jgi:hypothetical protein
VHGSSTLLLDSSSALLGGKVKLLVGLCEEELLMITELDKMGEELDRATEDELNAMELDSGMVLEEDSRESSPELEDWSSDSPDMPQVSQEEDEAKRSISDELETTSAVSTVSGSTTFLIYFLKNSARHSSSSLQLSRAFSKSESVLALQSGFSLQLSRALRKSASVTLSIRSNARISLFSVHSRLPSPQAQKRKTAKIGRHAYSILFIKTPLVLNINKNLQTWAGKKS